MRAPFIFLFLGLLGSIQVFSQSDTLNRFDANGEKTGWWIVYLDDDLKQLNDSIGATHYRYTLYSGKFDHYNMGTIGSKKNPVTFPANETTELGGLKLLNGDYSANHKNGKTRFILSAKNGVLTEYKEFYDNGQLKTHFIYSTECGAPIRCCIKMYDKNGTLTYDGHNMIPSDR